MRVMSAGKGVNYLLNSVVVDDGIRDATTALTRYYAEKGTPPGFWLGSGVPALGAGELHDGDPVEELHLRRLLGNAADPITGEALGRPLPHYKTLAQRIAAAVARLPAQQDPATRAEAITTIESDETRKPAQTAVAGFDHTFSVPKSVSALWAVADGGAQSLIADAHHAAIRDVLVVLERGVAMTRVGTDAGDGSVQQAEVRGIVATAYDHYDSRASDPQLHTHVVIANRVQDVADGRWRTLDSRMLHHAVVAMSELYNAVLADRLTRTLGLAWERRVRGGNLNEAFELKAVPELLIAEFSSRSHDIEAETDRLIADYEAKYGHRPDKAVILRLRAQATLSTRPAKEVHSLAELTERWRTRATQILGEDAPTWASSVLAGSGRAVLLRADDVSEEMRVELGQIVVDLVGQKRSTWRHWNLYAEASRQTMELRFASTTDREHVVAAIVAEAERGSIRLSPPELAHTPVGFRHVDGSSAFRLKHGTLFSSTGLLDAEDRLVALAKDTTAPTVEIAVVDRVTARGLPDGTELSQDQVKAVTAIALSGRRVDLLVGPAGAGKTSTLAALRIAWEQAHGRGSVIGLAPTAKAADVLAGELGIPAENTAKWALEHDEGRWDFRPGQLVILDEAGTAGTFALDRLTQHAAAVGAKVLLVGDPAQLDAVESSGAFRLVIDEIADHPELTEVWRFRHEWEKRASLALRLGEAAAIDAYAGHDRIAGGGYEAMLDAVYTGWRADLAAGWVSVMIAETGEAVTTLNQRARLDRVTAGLVQPDGAVALAEGTEAGRGDLVMTRKNDRRLRTRHGWVKNGDVWTVVRAHDDGSLTVRRVKGRDGAVRLPAGYVAEHLDLAYAVTAYRAQGSTVDTAHALVASSSMSRESLYVALTRGRWSNRAYVATDQAQLEEHQQQPEAPTATTILTGILRHTAAEASAHATIRNEQERWTNIAQLAAEYDTIAQAAQHDRWVTLLTRSGLAPEQVDRAATEESFGPLAAELRRAEANHHDPERLLRTAVAQREIRDSDDVAGVLRWRIQQATTPRTGSTRPTRAPRLIAGLIPAAAGITDPDLRRGLEERARLIEERARALVEAAVDEPAPWLRELGAAPVGRAAAVWQRHVAVVAAYRDRWQIAGDTALGPAPASTNQRIDAARAQAAINQARTLTSGTETGEAIGRDGLGVRL